MTRVNVKDLDSIETYARNWCERAGIAEQDIEDYIQEAQLNALKRNTTTNIRRSLDRYKYHDFTKLQRFTLIARPDSTLVSK